MAFYYYLRRNHSGINTFIVRRCRTSVTFNSSAHVNLYTIDPKYGDIGSRGFLGRTKRITKKNKWEF